MAVSSGDAVRTRICLYLREHPGAHFRELQRELRLSPGQAMHHLRVLEAQRFVVGDAETGDGLVHYFLHDVPRGPRRVQAALRQPARRSLARLLQARGPRTTRELVDATGLSPSTVHHHLRMLARAGVVAETGDRPARFALAADAAPMVTQGEARMPAVWLDEALGAAPPQGEGPLPPALLAV